MAANDKDNGVPSIYYEDPFSLDDMSDQIHRGLLAIGALATISVIFTSGLLTFITWRMISWKSHYTSFIGRNQSLLLIYQLILADLLQSLGFLISFHWAARRAIAGPDPVCLAQGWLIQLGDVASGFFVLAIALHTCSQVALSRTPRHRPFVAAVAAVWAFSLALTALAPILGGRYVFLRAGSWCWISEEHDGFRLGLHYIWIFIVQFGSILTYTAGFYSIYRGKYATSSRAGIQGAVGSSASTRALRRAATAMLAYACAYTVLTLPLAAGRMSTMSHRELPPAFYLVAGCLFTSSGWVDALLYTLTRRSLLFQELDPRGTTPHHHNHHHHHHHLGSQGRRGGGAPGSFHRAAASTDTILGEEGGSTFGGGGVGGVGGVGGGSGKKFGGIKVEQTVNVVVLSDLESSSSSSSSSTAEVEARAGLGARVTAEAHATRDFGL